jgi:hypothetical protein
MTRILAAVLTVTGMLALAACTSNPVQPVPEPAGSTGATIAPSTTPVVVPTPTPTPTGPTSFPVTLTCDQVVTPEQLYAFNPNYSATPGYAPTAGTDPATIVSLQGVACSWINQSSEDTIEIAVAHLAPADIENLKNQLVLSTPSVPTYGGVDYFVNDGTVGEANVFSNDYWIVARSVEFFEPGDAVGLIQSVKTNLG